MLAPCTQKLSGLCRELASGGGSKAKKARREAGDGNNPTSTGAAGELLQQLRRLGKGKALKSKALCQAVANGTSSLAAAAEDLDARLASAPPCGAEHGGKSKKRRQSVAGSGLGAAEIAAALAGAEAVLAVLARQPLACLEPAAATAVGALAVCSLLLGLQACVQRLAAAGAAPGAEALASRGLDLAACCLAALAQLGRGGAGGEGGWDAELPRVALAACAAAGCLAAAAGAAAQPALQRLQRCCQSLLAAHVSACLLSTERAGTLQPLAQQLGDALNSAAGQRLASHHWAAAVAAEALLKACRQAAAAAQTAESSHAAEIVCGPGTAYASAAAPDAAVLCAACQALEPAVMAAAAAARENPAGWAAPRVLGCCYGGLASLLLARCGSTLAAERLAAAGGQQGGVLGGLGNHLRAVATLLLEEAGTPLPRPAALQLLDFIAAACTAVHRMKPAASPAHFSSLTALVLHLLAALPEVPPALDPSRPTLPLSAAFPAARGASAGAAARRAVLAALKALVGGCDRGQLSLLLRVVEAELPVVAAGGNARALALCELALMVLEAPSGSRQQATLGQHGQRLTTALNAFVSRLVCGLQQAAELHLPEAAGGGLETVRKLQQRILAAAAANRAADGGCAESEPEEGAGTGQQLEPCVGSLCGPSAPAQPLPTQVAALCTALRAYESLAARPKLFVLPPQACIGMLQAVGEAWACFAAAAPADVSALPGFAYRLHSCSGAALFCESCHLLTTLLRHRAEELRCAAPLLVQAARGLLRFLVAAELSDGLARALGHGRGAGGSDDTRCEPPAWRLKCAEGLARVMAEVAALRVSLAVPLICAPCRRPVSVSSARQLLLRPRLPFPTSLPPSPRRPPPAAIAPSCWPITSSWLPHPPAPRRASCWASQACPLPRSNPPRRSVAVKAARTAVALRQRRLQKQRGGQRRRCWRASRSHSRWLRRCAGVPTHCTVPAQPARFSSCMRRWAVLARATAAAAGPGARRWRRSRATTSGTLGTPARCEGSKFNVLVIMIS